jgi:uncharacterized iron-regulated membrane protein
MKVKKIKFADPGTVMVGIATILMGIALVSGLVYLVSKLF